MNNCRVCGYTTKKNTCPHCNCNVIIDKNNYDWKQSSNDINWTQIN